MYFDHVNQKQYIECVGNLHTWEAEVGCHAKKGDFFGTNKFFHMLTMQKNFFIPCKLSPIMSSNMVQHYRWPCLTWGEKNWDMSIYLM